MLVAPPPSQDWRLRSGQFTPHAAASCQWASTFDLRCGTMRAPLREAGGGQWPAGRDALAGPALLVLRRATGAQHRRLEARFAVAAWLRSREEYLNLLERLHGFYAPVEASLAELDWTGVGIDFPSRRKAHLLAQDLAALGNGRSESAGRRAIPDPFRPANLALGFGCLYVLEGATLGGQIIGRRIREDLGIEPRNGGAFFASYGSSVGWMWREFRIRLEGYCSSPAARTDAACGAIATFAALDRWLFDCEGQPMTDPPRGGA